MSVCPAVSDYLKSGDGVLTLTVELQTKWFCLFLVRYRASGFSPKQFERRGSRYIVKAIFREPQAPQDYAVRATASSWLLPRRN